MSRPEIIDLNKDKLVFYLLSIKVNKCRGDCNNINDPMAKLCVPNIVKDMNIKVFNLLARINEEYMWNPSTCSCECDRYCETGQYLDYKNYVCRKKIIGHLIEQCTSIVDIDIKNNTLSKKSDKSSSYIYFILFIVFLVLFILFLV